MFDNSEQWNIHVEENSDRLSIYNKFMLMFELSFLVNRQEKEYIQYCLRGIGEELWEGKLQPLYALWIRCRAYFDDKCHYYRVNDEKTAAEKCSPLTHHSVQADTADDAWDFLYTIYGETFELF